MHTTVSFVVVCNLLCLVYKVFVLSLCTHTYTYTVCYTHTQTHQNKYETKSVLVKSVITELSAVNDLLTPAEFFYDYSLRSVCILIFY